MKEFIEITLREYKKMQFSSQSEYAVFIKCKVHYSQLYFKENKCFFQNTCIEESVKEIQKLIKEATEI